MTRTYGKRAHFLLVLATASLVIVWATAHRIVEQEREQDVAAAADRAQQLATFFERHTLNVFRYGDTYLRMAREVYLRDSGLDSVRALMSAVPLDRALISHITIIDADGVPVFNSRYPIKEGVSAADRKYFVHARTATDDSLYVSLPQRGRNSGALLVRMVRRIQTLDGRFGGVIFAALDVDSVTGFFSAMRPGAKSSATLVGNDKRIRARSSYGRLGPGQDISGSRIWAELERSPVGLYLQTSVVDQVTRYYAYRQLEEFPLVVTIGMATEDLHDAVADFRQPAYALAVLASVLILTGTFLFWREAVARQRLAESASRIRAMHDELEHRVVERTAELQAVQQELLRKQRLAVLGQLTGTVAHELRNPLGTIVTTVATIEHVLAKGGADLGLGAATARVRRSVDRCNSIISELLDFTRVTPLDLQRTRLDDWLAGLVTELAASSEVPIHFVPGADDATLMLDTERLRRALINLIDNARDAIADLEMVGEGGGEIRVLTRRGAERVEIEVQDNGPGIDAQQMAAVHEPLYSTKTYGIGLGLPVVHQVVEDQGGGFELHSEAGKGSRAVLWLPLQGDGPLAKIERADVPAAGQKD